VTRADSEVFIVLPWINVHAADDMEGAQRVALLERVVGQFKWADYGDAELYRYRGPYENDDPWVPPDTVEEATDRLHPYLGRSWLRQARAYGPAPRPFFVVRSYEPNPEARS
jgi:hypothetical protein